MQFKVEFCDSGIHQRIFYAVERPGWDEVDEWSKKKLEELVSTGRLHKDHAYVGQISRLDR